MARILHPRPDHGRQRFLGVIFHDGIADRDLSENPHLRDALIQHGYVVEEFAAVEMADKTVVGDGVSLATLIDGGDGSVADLIDGSAVRPPARSKSQRRREAAQAENVSDSVDSASVEPDSSGARISNGFERLPDADESGYTADSVILSED